jgi:hypothetical protein
MIEALKSCDAVYCSRASGRDNIPRLNQLGNALFQGIMRHVYRFEARDYATGLYGIKKRHLQKMRISSRGFAIDPEIAIKACQMKLKIHDIPIHYSPRIGQTKLSGFNAGFDHLRTMVRLLLWTPEPETRVGQPKVIVIMATYATELLKDVQEAARLVAVCIETPMTFLSSVFRARSVPPR